MTDGGERTFAISKRNLARVLGLCCAITAAFMGGMHLVFDRVGDTGVYMLVAVSLAIALNLRRVSVCRDGIRSAHEKIFTWGEITNASRHPLFGIARVVDEPCKRVMNLPLSVIDDPEFERAVRAVAPADSPALLLFAQPRSTTAT